MVPGELKGSEKVEGSYNNLLNHGTWTELTADFSELDYIITKYKYCYSLK